MWVRISFVYMLANTARCLYTGVTADLVRRVGEHRERLSPKSFCARYHIDQLVWYECWGDIRLAIAREKEIKDWRREKRRRLIEAVNPGWRDLAARWPEIEPLW